MIGVAIPMLTTFRSQRKLEHTGIVDVSNYSCNWKISAQQPAAFHLAQQGQMYTTSSSLAGFDEPRSYLAPTHRHMIVNIGRCVVMMQSKAY